MANMKTTALLDRRFSYADDYGRGPWSMQGLERRLDASALILGDHAGEHLA